MSNMFNPLIVYRSRGILQISNRSVFIFSSDPSYLLILRSEKIKINRPLYILSLHLNPLSRSPKHTIPKQRLLAIVLTLLPSLSMMQVMILSRQLRIKQPQKPVVCTRRNHENSQSRVTKQFREEEVVVTYPPIIESHRETKGKLHRGVGKKRNDGDIENLLLGIGVKGEKRVGMFSEMMRAVEFPESVVLVHYAVVPVEVEVEDNPVKTDLDG